LKDYGYIIYSGKTYKTVVIGTQVWMAENLNYDVTGSKCLGNDPANCDKYGILYYWTMAMALSYDCDFTTCFSQINTKHRGVCPSGWHIPSGADWDKLMRYADGTSGTSNNYKSPTAGKFLKAASGWNNCGLGSSYSYQCEDKYGFAALPGGLNHSVNVNVSTGISGYWWSHEYNTRDMQHANDSNQVIFFDKKEDLLFSVRCLQD
jgi:uncharacterized protein (TIGR02145 family)